MISPNCIHFLGYKPCYYSKKFDTVCENCSFYKPISKRILIIKLAGIGDVIRTTPILTRLEKLYPNSKIYWLTDFPEVLPKNIHVFDFSARSIEILKSINFDILFNLDKSLEACSLTNNIQVPVKKGFYQRNGNIYPIDGDAEYKYLTGIHDNLSKSNTKNYMEEVFEICGIGNFNDERYILPEIRKPENRSGIKRIGLNTGCGKRWESRLWPIEHWISLAENLLDRNYEIELLGGEQEKERNLYIASILGMYPLYKPCSILDFMELVNTCDLIVSSVTSTAHIAIGLGKKIVLLNNLFNSSEFYLYGLGEILEPEIECDCYYSDCKNDCMRYILPDTVLSTIEKLL